MALSTICAIYAGILFSVSKGQDTFNSTMETSKSPNNIMPSSKEMRDLSGFDTSSVITDVTVITSSSAVTTISYFTSVAAPTSQISPPMKTIASSTLSSSSSSATTSLDVSPSITTANISSAITATRGMLPSTTNAGGTPSITTTSLVSKYSTTDYISPAMTATPGTSLSTTTADIPPANTITSGILTSSTTADNTPAPTIPPAISPSITNTGMSSSLTTTSGILTFSSTPDTSLSTTTSGILPSTTTPSISPSISTPNILPSTTTAGTLASTTTNTGTSPPTATAGVSTVGKPRRLWIILVSAISGALMLVIVTTLIIFIMRKRRKDGGSSNETNATSGNPFKRVLRKSVKENNIYMNNIGRDVSISELKTFVIDKMKSDGFVGEYKALPAGLQAPHDAGKSTLNRHKNRFTDVYPYDDSRVRLQWSDDSRCDYINACYIAGYHGREKVYIAAQGPNEYTVADFWWMIWQEEVDCIVMLTNTVENNKRKCEKYWPEKEVNESHGNLEISCISTTTYPNSVSRIIHIHNTKETITRQLTQFHFVTWPDHGVPSTPSLVKFWKQVKQHAMFAEKPLLVHCSAGIGRTGTFIGLDILMERSKAESTVNVFHCVQTMRRERTNAVQTKSQYVFLHEALVEALYSTETNVSETELSSRVEQGRELMYREYQNLRELQELTSVSLENNQVKSRKHIPTLRIPCSSLMGEFLVPNSTPDDADDILWDHIQDYNVKVVIVISNEGFPSMIPTDVGESVLKGNSSITMTSLSYVTECLMEINIVIESAANIYENIEPKTVTLFMMSPVTSSVSGFLPLLERLEPHQVHGEEIVVYSNPDISSAILLCTISNITTTLQQHHEVDIFLTVREMTCLMPSFKISQADYELLYDLSRDYLLSQYMHMYTNMSTSA